MFEFLLDAAFAPFTLALAFLVGLLGLELVALLLGGSLMAGDGEPDFDINVSPEVMDLDLDLDIDLDADTFEIAEVEPEVAPVAATPGIASWLGMGHVPIMIWLAVLLMSFGLGGMGLQLILRDLIGVDAPALVAAVPAGVFGLWFARGFSAVFARLLPNTETEAVSERMLARRRGVITQGTAARGRPAEVRVSDRYGNNHYLRAEPLQDADVITQGTEVLVLRNRRSGAFVLIGLSE